MRFLSMTHYSAPARKRLTAWFIQETLWLKIGDRSKRGQTTHGSWVFYMSKLISLLALSRHPITVWWRHLSHSSMWIVCWSGFKDLCIVLERQSSLNWPWTGTFLLHFPEVIRCSGTSLIDSSSRLHGMYIYAVFLHRYPTLYCGTSATAVANHFPDDALISSLDLLRGVTFSEYARATRKNDICLLYRSQYDIGILL